MTQQGYPPGPPMGGFPGLPGIPNQQPQQPQQAAPGGYPPPQHPGYPPAPPQAPPGYPPPQAPPYPGHAPAPAPAPGGYPPPQAPYGQPAGGYPPPQAYPPAYQQPGAPPQGFPGNPQAQGFRRPQVRSQQLTGQAFQGVNPSGARHPFMTCIDPYRASTWHLEVMRTLQTEQTGAFAAEFKVHWTDLPGAEAGGMRTWIQTFDKGPQGLEVGLRAVKRFVLSAIGVDAEEQALAQGHLLEDLYSAVMVDDRQLVHPQTGQPLRYGPNPLKNRIVVCVVNPPKQGLNQRGQPHVFQLHNFSPKLG